MKYRILVYAGTDDKHYRARILGNTEVNGFANGSRIRHPRFSVYLGEDDEIVQRKLDKIKKELIDIPLTLNPGADSDSYERVYNLLKKFSSLRESV